MITTIDISSGLSSGILSLIASLRVAKNTTSVSGSDHNISIIFILRFIRHRTAFAMDIVGTVGDNQQYNQGTDQTRHHQRPELRAQLLVIIHDPDADRDEQ